MRTAVNFPRDEKSVPVDGRLLGQSVLYGDAETFALPYANLRAGNGGVVAPGGRLAGGLRYDLIRANALKALVMLVYITATVAVFAGCAVIISHDRWFLDRIATHILAFEGDSHVEWFEGNFAAYMEDKKRRLGPDADIPHRIKYKPLTR